MPSNSAAKMLKQQGSNRIYSRETDANGQSVIRVVGTNRDENHAFIYMSRHFAELGLPVPRVLWVSDDEMQYTQEDLGDTVLFDAIRHGRETGIFSEEERTLLKRTLRALAHIQVRGAQDFDWSVCFPVPAFDERSIRWDLNYFKYCFLRLTRIEFSEPRLEDDFDRMVKNLLSTPYTLHSTPYTFLYRDFQSRNVMLRDGQPYFIDFQGGRRGPTQYDVASFLWQARANFPQSLRDELIEEYLDELQKLKIKNEKLKINISEWKAALPHFVLFRTLQVLGAYGYRGYYERKPHFLQSIPNALRNLRELFAQHASLREAYPEIAALSEELGANPSNLNNPNTPNTPTNPTNLTVTVYSFSFKRGIPEDASGNGGGYVFDCRSTHNPGKYDEYKTLTGLDQPVIDFLEQDGEILRFLESVDQLVDHHVERFLERGFTHLQVSFGCTGGQHRSVYSAEHVARRLHEKYGIRIHLIHRERGIDRWLE
ncbi:MAG: phosphotransferase [Paludibacteraceae bacterium]|nr:phosphotransferase [Paludibacteraceae bacterium]